MVPPSNAMIPFLPLTDTEIIVYFFNSLCRPIVSLRLYARGWGPAAISDAINSHRVVKPAYLRNTCSVKCTTAIKKGIEKYGEEWDVVTRAKFQVKDMTDGKPQISSKSRTMSSLSRSIGICATFATACRSTLTRRMVEYSPVA
jgi:hypothetical protein